MQERPSDESAFLYWKPWWVSHSPRGQSALLESKGQVLVASTTHQWSWNPEFTFLGTAVQKLLPRLVVAKDTHASPGLHQRAEDQGLRGATSMDLGIVHFPH